MPARIYKPFPGRAGLASMLVLVLVIVCGCNQNALLRGTVTDPAGEALPGVNVRVSGTDFEDLSNANGRYSIHTSPGELQLDFYKTGYTSAHLKVVADSYGITKPQAVSLIPLPGEEGVFYLRRFRYFHTDHPRINRYSLGGGESVPGTPVQPRLVIDYADPQTNPEENPPRLISHKLPAYNALLHKMRSIKASESRAASGEKTPKGDSASPYQEEILVADEPIQLISKILDEPEGQLVELRAVQPLTPGIYAVHWGALTGYDSLDPRAFIFAIREKEPETTEKEGEADRKDS